MSKAFEVDNVVKHFGKVKALEGVTLSAEEGKVFGLLGPNGAGKTTIVKVLSTLLEPDKGVAKVHGINVVEKPGKVRELIGLAGQYAAVDEFLTGYENVYMTGLLYGLDRKESRKRTLDLLDRFKLTDAANRTVRTYSGGMRRRLDLGSSLVGRPKILFLDEPTTGLDPQTRLDMWEIVRELVSEGTSILLTTQYLEEADELADMIAVVNEGKVIAEGTSSQLKNRLGGDVVEFVLKEAADKDIAMTAVQKFAKNKPLFEEATQTVTVPVKNGSKSLMEVVQALNDAKLSVAALSLHRPSLDDVFLALTGSKVVEAEPQTKKGGRR
jgi:ABC-2 type transport system ATP-binding protein